MHQLDEPWRRGVDLSESLAALQRRRSVLLGIWGACIGAACLHWLVARPVWQGEFQIVVTNGSNSFANAVMAQNPQLAAVASIAGGNQADSKLKTDIKILQSPSVLLPVYRFVQAQKRNQPNRPTTFNSWVKSSVRVKPEKGTEVVKVQYRDSDRALVLPTTIRIAEAYKAHSDRQRRRELVSLIGYLDQQTQRLQQQADQSNATALAFADQHELELADGLPISAAVRGSGVMGQVGGNEVKGGNLEANRGQLRKRIAELELQLSQVKRAGANAVYVAAGTPARAEIGPALNNLSTIEAQLAEKRSLLREADPVVKQLERERRALIAYINNQTQALLRAELGVAQANLGSLVRPKAVLKQHRDLTQRALRQEATLVELQNNLNNARLELARKTAPWDLAASPTLAPDPSYPNLPLNLIVGTLAGLVLGCGGALLVDRRANRVYGTGRLTALLPYPLLAELDPKRPAHLQRALQLLAAGPLGDCARICLIPAGAIDNLEELRQGLDASLGALDGRACVQTGDVVSSLHQSQCQLIVASPGAASADDLRALVQELDLQGQPVIGLIVLHRRRSPGWLAAGHEGIDSSYGSNLMQS